MPQANLKNEKKTFETKVNKLANLARMIGIKSVDT